MAVEHDALRVWQAASFDSGRAARTGADLHDDSCPCTYLNGERLRHELTTRRVGVLDVGRTVFQYDSQQVRAWMRAPCPSSVVLFGPTAAGSARNGGSPAVTNALHRGGDVVLEPHVLEGEAFVVPEQVVCASDRRSKAG